MHVKENLMTKICLHRRSLDRIRQLSVCCHGYTFAKVTNISATFDSLTGSI